MLASLRLRTVRHALVIMLMILSAFIAMERAQAVIDGVQHALAIDHDAPALQLAAAGHGHDHDHDRRPAGEVGVTETGDQEQDQAPGAHHHHHSEGPQIAAQISPVTIEVAGSGSEAPFLLADTGSPQSRIFGLERPPKALSERA